MTTRLKVVFALFFLTILATTTWASIQLPFYKTPQSLVTHPWFIATLVDAYLGFLTFWLWVVYKETSNGWRLVWLVLIFTLGNMAMAGYALLTLFRLPPGATIEDFLLRSPRRA